MTEDRAQMKFGYDEWEELHSIILYYLGIDEDKTNDAWYDAWCDHSMNTLMEHPLYNAK